MREYLRPPKLNNSNNLDLFNNQNYGSYLNKIIILEGNFIEFTVKNI